MKLRGKLLYSVLAAYFALLPVKSTSQSLGRLSKYLPTEYSELQGESTYRVKYKNNGYTGTLVTGGEKGAAWFIFDTTNQKVIGDEKNEWEDYSNLALTFEIERFDNWEPNYHNSLKDLSEGLRIALIEYETTYNIPMFFLEKGSRVEGILAGVLQTGGANLPTQIQSEIIKKITSEESEKIKQKIFKDMNITEKELEDSKNIVNVTKKIKKYFENTLEYRVTESMKNLEEAANIFERYKGAGWTYESAKVCSENWITGYVIGRAYLRVMDDLEKNVDWKLIAKKISSNFAEGYTGIPAEQIFKFQEIQVIFNSLNKYIEEEFKIFNPMIGRYNIENQKNAAYTFLNSSWPEIKAPQNTGASQTVLDFLNIIKNKNIGLLIKDRRFRTSDFLIKDLANAIILADPSQDRDSQERVMGLISKIYLCNKTSLVQLPSSNGYEIFYLKPVQKVCDDGFSDDFTYSGEIFYLKNENNSWNIKEIVPLSKQDLRQRALHRLSNLATEAIAQYAETNSWPEPFSQEPRTIPDLTKNPLGVECNIPFYERFPSKGRCFFSYKITPEKINPNDVYVIEAVGNLDNDPDLEVIQMGVGSKQFKSLRRD